MGKEEHEGPFSVCWVARGMVVLFSKQATGRQLLGTGAVGRRVPCLMFSHFTPPHFTPKDNGIIFPLGKL